MDEDDNVDVGKTTTLLDLEADFEELEEYVQLLRSKPENPRDVQESDPHLPPRLFVRDYYPVGGRINSCSKVDLLFEIAEILKGTQELTDLLCSQFGRLFELPARKASFSGKIVHNMLCRQLWTSKPHELWFVFGGKPFRFSLREFWIVTGLKCGRFPDAKLIEAKRKTEGVPKMYLDELVGHKKPVKVQELLELMKKHKKWPGWRKFRVSLILIVDGVLTGKAQNGYVQASTAEMCRDLGFFLNYPWGRESFNITLNDLVPSKTDEGKESCVARLKQTSVIVHGFPLAIQLLAYEAISSLEGLRREDGDEMDLTQRSTQELVRKQAISDDDIIKCELSEELSVIPLLPQKEGAIEEDMGWDDEGEDPNIKHLHTLLSFNSEFKKEEWPGGDYSCARGLTPEEKAAVREFEVEKKKRGKADVQMEKPLVEEKKRKVVPSTASTRKSKRLRSDATPAECSGSEQVNANLVEIVRKEVRGCVETEMKEYMATSLLPAITDEIKSCLNREIREAVQREVHGVYKAMMESGVIEIKRRSTQTEGKGVQMTGVFNEVGKTDEEAGLVKVDGEGVDKATEEKWNDSKEVKGSLIAEKSWSDYDRVAKVNKSADTDMEENEGEGAEEVVGGKASEQGGVDGVNEYCTGEADARADETLEVHARGVVDPMLDEAARKAALDIGARHVSQVASLSSSIADTQELDSQGEDGKTTEKAAGKSKKDGDDEGEESLEADTTDSDDEGEKEEEGGGSEEVAGEETSNVVPRRGGRSRRLTDKKQPLTTKKAVADVGKELKNTYKKVMDAMKEKKTEEFLLSCGFEADASLFTKLGKKNEKVDGRVVELLSYLLWHKHGTMLMGKRSTVIDQWAMTYIRHHALKYAEGYTPREFKWNIKLRNYVSGALPARPQSLEWVKDVDILYCPMHWEASHWVALVINIRDKTILVFDPCTSAASRVLADKYMPAIVSMLPNLIADCFPQADQTELGRAGYKWEMFNGLSKTFKVGDCGPVAMKLLEMKASGCTDEEICAVKDKDVADIRKKFIVELYESFVE